MIWLLFALLVLGACAFVLLPLLHTKNGRTKIGPESADARILGTNKTLYQEKLAELDRLQSAGEIDAAQRRELQLEAQKQLLRESEGALVSSGVAVTRVTGRGSPVALVLTALVVAVTAILLYRYLGAQDQVALAELLQQRDEVQSADSGAGEGRLQAIDSRLQKRLQILVERYPKELDYRLMLARLYQDQGEFPMAVVQLRAILAASPSQAPLLAEYAQALFFASGNRITVEVQAAIDQVLALAPENATVRGLQGIAAFHSGDYREAITHWELALLHTPPVSPGAEALRAGIANARQKLGLPGAAEPQAPTAAGGTSNFALQVQVRLADDFSAPPNTPVFVYAREWQGAPMPVAIQRLTAADLPALIRLDETMAMTPALSLATVKQVELVARVALSGAARPAPGDLEGRSGPFEPGVSGDPIVLTVNNRLQ